MKIIRDQIKNKKAAMDCCKLTIFKVPRPITIIATIIYITI
jgi:hypothetical protein